ncbi:uncharacterized protein LOC130673114 isoform X1 [Microplitis mediator]|uniref:uncharacterized protein LOC130673114 isoform X1 n=1 Tax=Microplitis mediator TaxID=375433 RepID=UPI0025539A38|nr:uncharacterized protein LOC130673114 isoform X1 [Microplitis mediator]
MSLLIFIKLLIITCAMGELIKQPCSPDETPCRRNHQCCSSSCIASEYSTSKVCGSLYNTDVIITKMTSKPVDAEINQPTKKCVQMGKLCSSHDNCCSKLCAIVKSTRICVMDQNHKDRKPN